MSSEDRWTYPTEGADPRDIDRETSDAEVAARKQAERAVSHDQPRERSQGTTADAPGVDASDRERADGQPTVGP